MNYIDHIPDNLKDRCIKSLTLTMASGVEGMIIHHESVIAVKDGLTRVCVDIGEKKEVWLALHVQAFMCTERLTATLSSFILNDGIYRLYGTSDSGTWLGGLVTTKDYTTVVKYAKLSDTLKLLHLIYRVITNVNIKYKDTDKLDREMLSSKQVQGVLGSFPFDSVYGLMYDLDIISTLSERVVDKKIISPRLLADTVYAVYKYDNEMALEYLKHCHKHLMVIMGT